DHTEAGDDFLGFGVGTVGHDASGLDDPAAGLQTVAADDRRPVLLHPCVPGRLQTLHFLRSRLGAAQRGLAKDEQKLRHDGTPDGFAYTAEACPPPCVNTTNERQPFRHRRGKKTWTHPIRFAQLVEPMLPLLAARGCVWIWR